jgi:hypothetical protein
MSHAQKKTAEDTTYVQETGNVPTAFLMYQMDWLTDPSIRNKYENKRAAWLETLGRKIFLRKHLWGSPPQGLDNGFDAFTVCGPVINIVYFTEKELDDLKAEGHETKFSDGTPLRYKSMLCGDGLVVSYSKSIDHGCSERNYGGYSILEPYYGYVGKYSIIYGRDGIERYIPASADPTHSYLR